jgi:hypothetical protein
MTVIKVSLVGGPVGGSIVTVKTDRDGTPPEWHEMVSCPNLGNPEEEPRFEHHLYRRVVPPGHEGPLWLYQHQHPHDPQEAQR